MKESFKREQLSNAKNSYQKGDKGKAQTILSDIIESTEDNVQNKELLIEAYFYLANIFHTKGEIGKAIKAFQKVLSLEPGHTDAAISLSVLYNDIGHYEDAKKIFDRANERVKTQSSSNAPQDQHINKKFGWKHYELADLYMTYNRFEEALFEYNKAVKLDPENLEARIKVAKVYAKKGFTMKAVDELKRLKNEHPDYLAARIALGVLMYGHGKIIEAQKEWESVLAKSPNHGEASMYLNLSRTATETSLY